MESIAYKKIFDQVISHEGGYVNDPNDAGGETKYGISKRAYPDLDIKNLTIDDAFKIYKEDYWRKCKCDAIKSPLSMMLFDIAVNQGPFFAAKALQKAVGATVDGVIGPKTISKSNAFDLSDALFNLYRQRNQRYVASCRARNSNLMYLDGWLNRSSSVLRFCLEEIDEL